MIGAVAGTARPTRPEVAQLGSELHIQVHVMVADDEMRIELVPMSEADTEALLAILDGAILHLYRSASCSPQPARRAWRYGLEMTSRTFATAVSNDRMREAALRQYLRDDLGVS